VVEDLILSRGNLFEVGISPAESPDSVAWVFYPTLSLGLFGFSESPPSSVECCAS
jgi:hypothetical protein